MYSLKFDQYFALNALDIHGTHTHTHTHTQTYKNIGLVNNQLKMYGNTNSVTQL